MNNFLFPLKGQPSSVKEKFQYRSGSDHHTILITNLYIRYRYVFIETSNETAGTVLQPRQKSLFSKAARNLNKILAGENAFL